jgi:hypothetical protein
MQEHPPGLVGILSGELSRYAKFWECVLAMYGSLPEGSSILPLYSQWTADNINRFVEAMQPQHAWLAIWANDHEFRPDVTLRLLAHNVALVAPLCPLRSPPNHYSMFHDLGDRYQSYTWEELQGQRGLIPVDAFGGPGLVIRREVIEAIGQPFWMNDPRSPTNPREDLYSISRIRKAGFQPYVDLDTPIAHDTVLTMWPTRDAAGNYGVAYYQGSYLIGVLYSQHLRHRNLHELIAEGDRSYHVFID